MNFDPDTLFLSFVLGFIGLGLFIYGKKQARLPQLVAGVLFMVYPYFTSSLTSMLTVGLILGAGLWWLLWMGW
jgi:hypothetical protein